MTKKKDEKIYIPPVNVVSETLRRYAKARGLTSDDIAKELGCSGANVRYMLGRNMEEWKLGDLEKYCVVVSCPLGYMLDEIRRRVA